MHTNFKDEFSRWLTVRSGWGVSKNYIISRYDSIFTIKYYILAIASLFLPRPKNVKYLFYGHHLKGVYNDFPKDDVFVMSGIREFVGLRRSGVRCGMIYLVSLLGSYLSLVKHSDILVRFLKLYINFYFSNQVTYFIVYEDTMPTTYPVVNIIKKLGIADVITIQHGVFNINDWTIEGANSDASFVYNTEQLSIFKSAAPNVPVYIVGYPDAPKCTVIRESTILLLGVGAYEINSGNYHRSLKYYSCVEQMMNKVLDVKYRPHPSEICSLKSNELYGNNFNIESASKEWLLSHPPLVVIGFNSTLLYELEQVGSKVINCGSISDLGYSCDDVIQEVFEIISSGSVDKTSVTSAPFVDRFLDACMKYEEEKKNLHC